VEKLAQPTTIAPLDKYVAINNVPLVLIATNANHIIVAKEALVSQNVATTQFVQDNILVPQDYASQVRHVPTIKIAQVDFHANKVSAESLAKNARAIPIVKPVMSAQMGSVTTLVTIAVTPLRSASKVVAFPKPVSPMTSAEQA